MIDSADCTRTALRWIEEQAARVSEISDEIWRKPELGLMERETSRLLADEAERHGFRVERGVARMPTAFLATWGEGAPVVGLLGELDALPGLSQKAIPKREAVAEGAAGHGCGHNIHGTTALAAALALRHALAAHGIRGTIRFYGCPAEETLDGKVWLARMGCFQGMDVAMSHHPGSANTTSMGSSLAMSSLKFHFAGVASHAAGSPERGRSALDAVELMNVGANYLREHIGERSRIHYVVQHGGVQPNVVPPRASSWYYVRAPERGEVEEIQAWLLDVARGADLMAQTSHRVELLGGCHDLIPNKVLCDLVVRAMRDIGAPRHTREEIEFARELARSIPREGKRQDLARQGRPGWEELVDELFDERILDAWNEGRVMPGSTDVGDVSWLVPATEFSTAACVLGTPGHSWQFAAQAGMSIGHQSLLFASKVMAASAIELLTNAPLLDAAREEWRKRLAGRTYRSPLPPDAADPVPPAAPDAR